VGGERTCYNRRDSGSGGNLGDPVNSGDSCRITHDIIVDGAVAFKKGERVSIEKVDPNQQRPQYRYVTLSRTLDQRFQLSDSDITPLPKEVPKPEARTAWSPRTHRLLIGAGVAVLVLAVSFTLIFFLVIRQNKVVPNVMGLTKNLATQKIESTGFKVSYRYHYSHPNGKEKVIEQKPVAGTKDKKVKVVDILLTDREMESALAQATGAVAQANAALQEVQTMGIDTSDLGQAILTAQARLDNADCIEDCVGQTDSSAHWAGVAINACQAKKQEFAVNQERDRQIANCRSAMLSYARASSAPGVSMSFSSFSMNSDGTSATAMLNGTIGGVTLESAMIKAVRRGDTWVVTDFGTGIY
jgi:PASTA domain